MNEAQLYAHIKKFDERPRRPRYLLSIQTPNYCTSAKVSDVEVAQMLCATAELSGVCEFLTLWHHPDANTEKVLFASGSKQIRRKSNRVVKDWIERKLARG